MSRRKTRKSSGRPAAKKDASAAVAAIDRPTPEQELRCDFEFGENKTEMGVKIGSSYHRRPHFETLAARTKTVSTAELAALRFYRAAHERSERSPTKSCLNAGFGGGGVNGAEFAMVMSTPSIAEAKRKVRLCEAVLGNTLSTVRSVALEDLHFSDIAIARFGGRKQDWIVDEEPVVLSGRIVKTVDPKTGVPMKRKVTREKIVPLSWRHRDIVRQEFEAGLRLLTAQVRALVSAPGIEEVWVQLGDDAPARICRGVCAPNGLFRMWGGSAAVDAVMRSLHATFGEELKFGTPDQAREALVSAGRLRLQGLDPVELAA